MKIVGVAVGSASGKMVGARDCNTVGALDGFEVVLFVGYFPKCELEILMDFYSYYSLRFDLVIVVLREALVS